ncbi:MAG TPA: hydantoinase/oxoprolinase family protein [Rhizobiaceae bacterium]|nr:hydantoinase/oxoprolinase family protein [Rhizobiaceae bacterium]
MIRVGVDVGGTFTDVILEKVGAGRERQIVVTKVPSTPQNQADGVVNGVLQACSMAGVAPGDIDILYHGTTVATNMVIERSGAKVGMITTRGFRDILHMARHKRPHNFSLQFDVPWQSKPLVKRRDRLSVTERIMPPDGRIETPLDEDEVKRAAELFAKRGMDAVIICFLFSFLNDTHEQRAKEIVRQAMPDAFVNCSSEVVNTIREYERFSSAAMNAYIGPKTSNYLDSLSARLKQAGVDAIIRVMQSNGGIATVEQSSRLPIGLLLSGPAGGVIGGGWTGRNCDVGNIITIDIGGTSADISVIQNGELRIKNPRDTTVDLLPVLVPMVDIDAIGAGGGSIAYIDPGGAFRVGPRSAGAEPGPACYGKGGAEPTVTDAQVVLGRLDPEQFLGGDIELDPELSVRAIKNHIADRLGMSVKDAALGILKIINNNMALAINANSVAKGVDPRNFSLMGFGGAGPLHAVSLAEAIHARNVISPIQPGITAATGLLVTDLQYEYTSSTLMVINTTSPDDLRQLGDALDGLAAKADAQFEADAIEPAARRYQRFAECRYVGQGFELRARIPDGPVNADSVRAIVDNFYDVHKQVYGHAFKDQLCEVITLRLVATAAVETLEIAKLEPGGETNPQRAAMYVRKTVFDDGSEVETPRYRRSDLKAGDRITGPAIIIQHNSTTIVPPGYEATVESYGDLVIGRD